MADNPLGSHIQGCLDEGQPADNERPVLIAFEDVNGNVEVPNLTAAGSLPVDIGPGPFPVSGTVDVSDRSERLVGHVTVDNFPATQPVSGTVTANQGTPNAGGANSWPVSINQPAPTIFTSGTLAANGQTVELACDGYGEVLIETLGSFSGNITVQISEDGGSTWSNTLQGYDIGLNLLRSNLNAPLITARYSVAGANRVRTLASGWVSGTATIQMRSVATNGVVVVISPVVVQDFNGNKIFISPTSDPQPEANVLWTAARGHVWDGVFWWRLRTPSIFKTVAATAAGNTALWTPAAGKKFRLMKYQIFISDNATQAAPGTLTINLLDNAGNIAQTYDVFVPAVGLLNTGALFASGWVDLSNGILSAVANNILNINLSAALTAGNVRVIACGTEE